MFATLKSRRYLLVPATLLCAITAACSSDADCEGDGCDGDADSGEVGADATDAAEDIATDTEEDTATDTEEDGSVAPITGPDPTLFADGAIVGDVEVVDCTLSGGTQTQCYSFTIAGAPASHDVGPFCPRSIDDGPEAGGIWIEDGQTWDISGAWITELADFYDDDEWQLYDEATGLVYVTDTQESCEGAARPDVLPEYQNHCVECDLEYMTIPLTYDVLIPVEPVMLSSPSQLDRRGKVGIALSGVVFDPPAPVDAILAAHTIAAFDDCGGHVNLNEGYHYHAATGCSEGEAQPDGHAALIGYALDGFGIFSMTNTDGVEPDDLDVCRGHEDESRGYHYHVASAGENLFIGCFMGETGEVLQ